MQQPTPEQFLVGEVARRTETDYRFRWGPYLGWSVLTVGAYSHYGTYRLVRRRRNHATRRLAVSSYLWHTLVERSDSLGRRPDVQEGLDNLSRIHAQIEGHERRHARSTQLWVALRIAFHAGLFVGLFLFGASVESVGTSLVVVDRGAAVVGSFIFDASVVGLLIVGGSVNHFLNSDFIFLDTWEGSWAQNVEWVLNRLGYQVSIPGRHYRVPHRNTFLYIVLTILTIGLFSIFWRYSLTVDGNQHFDGDRLTEDRILEGLGLAGGPVSAVPPRLP